MTPDDDVDEAAARRPAALGAAAEWVDTAEGNVERWGNQRPKVLALALAEELAEIVAELLADDEPRPRWSYDVDADARVRGDETLDLVRVAGFSAREYLEEFHEDENGDPRPPSEVPPLAGVADRDAALEELHDLAPLVYQLRWALLDTEGGVDR